MQNIKPKIDEYSDKNIFLGGDINTYLDINLTKKGGKKNNIQLIIIRYILYVKN